MKNKMLLLLAILLLASCGPKRLGCGPKRRCVSVEKVEVLKHQPKKNTAEI